MSSGKKIEKKIENYWYYYKYHTFAGIFAIIVLGLIIYSFATRNNTADFVVADGLGYMDKYGCNDMKKDFAEYIDEEAKKLVFTAMMQYPKGEAAEIVHAKGLKASLEDGDTDAVFMLADGCYDSSYVGDMRNILPEDLYASLEENSLIMYENGENISSENEDGDNASEGSTDAESNNVSEESTNEKIPVGIYITGQKKFKEFFGEINDVIVLQISEKSKNKDNTIKFVKYITGL